MFGSWAASGRYHMPSFISSRSIRGSYIHFICALLSPERLLLRFCLSVPLFVSALKKGFQHSATASCAFMSQKPTVLSLPQVFPFAKPVSPSLQDLSIVHCPIVRIHGADIMNFVQALREFFKNLGKLHPSHFRAKVLPENKDRSCSTFLPLSLCHWP